MTGSGEDKRAEFFSGATTRVSTTEELPYSVDLWREDGRDVERTLARALSIHLARAIFTAAQTEFPGRRITLRRDESVVSDTVATGRL